MSTDKMYFSLILFIKKIDFINTYETDLEGVVARSAMRDNFTQYQGPLWAQRDDSTFK